MTGIRIKIPKRVNNTELIKGIFLAFEIAFACHILDNNLFPVRVFLLTLYAIKGFSIKAIY